MNILQEIQQKGYAVIEDFESQQAIKKLLNSVIESDGRLTKYVFDYWTRSQLTELICKLIGEYVFGHTCNIRNKKEEAYKIIPYHQDAAYILPESLKNQHFLQLTCWLPLVNVTKENGTIQVCSSFQNTLKEHSFSKGYLQVEENTNPFIPIEIRTGSLLIIHHNLIHGSGINQTSDTRWSIDFRYQNLQIKRADNLTQGFEIKPNLSLNFQEFQTKRIRLSSLDTHNFSLIKW